MRAERTREILERMGVIPPGDDEAWERQRAHDEELADIGWRKHALERAAEREAAQRRNGAES